MTDDGDRADGDTRSQPSAGVNLQQGPLQTAIEKASVALFVLGPDLSVRGVNEAAEAYFDLDREAIHGMDNRDLVESRLKNRFERPERFVQTVARTYENDAAIEDFECHVLPSEDRDERWLLYQSYPIETGELAGGRVEHYTDITSRKERERRFKRDEQLVENLPVGVFRTTPEGEYIDVNERYAELMADGSREAILAADPRELYVDIEDRKRILETLREDGSFTDREIEVQSLSGDRFWVSTTMTLREDDVTYIEGISQDITERKEREQKLETTTEQLEVLNRVLRHDIRNDVQVLQLWAERLLGDVAQDHEQKITQILNLSQQIEELTENSKALIQTVTSETEFETEPVRLDEVVREEVQKARSRYGEAVITLDSPVPAVSVLATEMLSSVFKNLLNNAVQHTPGQAHVDVRVETAGETARVTVADDGPGVPDDQKETIFGKGERGLDSEGTGIGLYLVNELVTNYDGDVWVEDNEPSGAVFVVTLPHTGDADRAESADHNE